MFLHCSAFLQNSSMTPWTLNLMVYVVALVLTEIVTNNAAAALVLPIALSAAKALDISYKPFAMSVIMAASCGFAIPYGYACVPSFPHAIPSLPHPNPILILPLQAI
jgi:di/tricarboxylate transporter